MISHYLQQIDILLETCLIIGVCACSISGALRAIDSKMDITGALLLAFIVSNAGGTFRDLFLGAPVFWIVNQQYIWLSIVVGATTFLLYYYMPHLKSLKTLNKMILFTDAIGLSVFCLAGVQKSFLMGHNSLIAIIMGIWTAVGGGVIADIIANRIPLVLAKELYIIVALLGAIMYILLSFVVIQAVAALIAFLFMVIFRLISVKYHLNLLAHD